MIGNRLTTAARRSWALGLMPSWEAGGTAWSIAVVSAGYVFSDADLMLDAVDPGDLLGVGACASRLVLPDGAFDADDLSIPATDGLTWAGLWLIIDTGVAATSPLIGWFDTQPDDTPLVGTVAGGSIDIEWPTSGLLRL